MRPKRPYRYRAYAFLKWRKAHGGKVLYHAWHYSDEHRALRAEAMAEPLGLDALFERERSGRPGFTGRHE